jgi:hypothetical protein
MGVEDDPSIGTFLFIIPMATGAHKASCYEDLGVHHNYLMGCSNGSSACFRKVR